MVSVKCDGRGVAVGPIRSRFVAVGDTLPESRPNIPLKGAALPPPLSQHAVSHRFIKTWHEHCYDSWQSGATTPDAGHTTSRRAEEIQEIFEFVFQFRGRSGWFADHRFGGSQCPRSMRFGPDSGVDFAERSLSLHPHPVPSPNGDKPPRAQGGGDQV